MMQKYRVVLSAFGSASYSVDAENPAEALEIVSKKYAALGDVEIYDWSGDIEILDQDGEVVYTG